MDALQKIQALLDERHWSRYKLAERAGISHSTLSNMFNRNNQPTLPILEAIVEKGFGLTLGQFFRQDEEPMICTTEEIKWIHCLHKLDSEQQKAILNLITSIVKDECKD